MIGQRIGHYQILDKLGEGGMGEVYLAEDIRLKRQVALKVLPVEMAASRERVERFQREAEALAALDHPNIVTIYSVEEEEDVRFLTMQRVTGKRLAELILAGGMPLHSIFEIAIPLADALAAAHEKGVIHRDLKPSNIMVDDRRRVRVLDFGLAKLGMEEAATSATELPTEPLTREGRILGTMPYMSPEQLEGSDLDGRSDIFSLGVVLYEMVTGERPFKGDTSVSLISSIVKDAPPEIETVRGDLPRHLSRVINHCLEKDPRRRYQSILDVRNEIRALESEVASGARAKSAVLSTAVGPARSRRWWPILVGAALLLLAAIWIGRSWIPGSDSVTSGTADRPRSERPILVVLPLENLGPPEDAYFAAGMTEEITSRLASVSDLGVISRTSATQYDRTGKTVSQIREDLGVSHVLEGTVRWARSVEDDSRVRVTLQLIQAADDTHLWADSFDRVIDDVFEVQSDIAQVVLRKLDVRLLDPERQAMERQATDNLEAYDFFLKGIDYLDRSDELQQRQDNEIAVQMLERAVELDPDFAAAHARLSLAHGSMYRTFWDRSDHRMELTRQAADRALELDSNLPDGHLAMGYYHRELFELEDAAKEFEAVLQKQPNNGLALAMLGGAQRSLARWDEALMSYERASELLPRQGSLSCALGGIHLALRNYQQADDNHRRAGSLAPDRPCPQFCQAWIYMAWDEGTERVRSFLENLPANVELEADPPILYPWVFADMVDGLYLEALERLAEGEFEALQFWFYYIPKAQLKAQVYGLMGRPASERAQYDAAREMMEARVREKPRDARFHSALGIAYAGLGRTEEAIREGKLAVDMISVDKDMWLGPFRKKDLAHIYTLVGDYDSALKEIEFLLANPTYYSTPLIRMDPTWAPLRDHPRFQALMEKYG